MTTIILLSKRNTKIYCIHIFFFSRLIYLTILDKIFHFSVYIYIYNVCVLMMKRRVLVFVAEYSV